ncbi:hypothetical protein BKA83DRAFT_3629476 [Pisolithus microcarpus]|nr:hypothetical protein BKA83DRAFT_3629476 [Pisolithus microcarpus]
MPENVFRFICLVRGDSPNSVFSVQLPCSAGVFELREAIKDEKHYVFPANQLVLYRASEQVVHWCSDDADGLMEAVNQGDHTKLYPWCSLSTIFNQSEITDGIDVLVEVPSALAASYALRATLDLNCLVLGDTPDHIFPVELANSETVGALREVIKSKKQHALHGVDADQLSLYRTSLPNNGELEDKLGSLAFDEPLLSTSILASIFTDLPLEGHLHIVV